MGSRLEANSKAVRKRIEAHTFTGEDGDEYEASSFGGFGEYMRRKRIKLQNLDAERRARSSAEGGSPAIFRGVVAYVNGYTQPSLGDLHKMIVDHGGGFQQYLDGKTACTHIIAANITPKKREEFKRYRIVKPAWVVDSIQAGRLLPWDDYRLIEDVRGQRTIGFNDGKVVSQTGGSQDRRTYREQTDASWYAGQVRAKAEMVDGRSPGSTAMKSTQDVYRASVVRPRKGGPSSAEEQPSPSEHPQHEEASTEEAEAAPEHVFGDSEDWEKISPDPDSPAGDNAEESVDEHARKKASYLTSEDLRPDDAGDWQRDQGSATNKKPMTAEEHNAVILADPKMWKSTVVNPAFLKQYYEESRLHHLSTWKAELKSQLQALALEQSSSQKERLKRPKGARRYVLHVDFDSFFVAVSMLKHPELKELPAVVAHGGGSGSEIASCNYPARKFGVKNGMWMKRAQELCPNLKVLPYDFPAYENASRKFYQVIMGVGGIVQSVSIDEALVDISVLCRREDGRGRDEGGEGSIDHEQARVDEIAQSVRDQVKELTGCAVSVGAGANILQAKLALRKAKPAGQYQLRPDDVLDFIGALTVQDLPGVAYSTGNKLEEIGIKYIKDIRETTKERLMATMGPKTGEKLWEYARGIDKVEVGEQTVRKSVSAEVNWGIRFATQEQAEEFICSICEELEKRLLAEAVKGRQLTLKIMRRSRDAPLDPPKHLGHGKCDVFNKSIVLGVATNDKKIISRETLSLLRGFGFSPGELRGIGVQMTKLEPLKGTTILPESSQRTLTFGKSTESPSRQETSPFLLTSLKTPSKQRAVAFIKMDDTPNGDLMMSTPARVPTLQGNDEVDSPHKARTRDVLGLSTPQNGMESFSDSILNTTGTQFMLPSQVDPEVMAALPDDIRARFARASTIAKEKSGKSLAAVPALQPNSPVADLDEMITASQLDPDTLAALPDDIREEILAQYRQRGSPRPVRQAVLPQSPRPVRSMKMPGRKPTSKRGGLLTRGRGRGRGSRMAPSAGDGPTLTQANFVFSKLEREDVQDESDAQSEDIPSDVLNELPADIKAEILEQQQRDRLRRKGGLDLARKKKAEPVAEGTTQSTLEFAARAPRPTFTSRKLSTLPELREAVSAWFEGTKDEEVAMEDVESLSGYLRRVILEEKDMHKAISVVKWLLWLIDEGGQEAEEKWESAAGKLTEDVQIAVTDRGLGKVEF